MKKLEQGWMHFQEASVIPNTSIEEVILLQGAFYAGASVAILAIADEQCVFPELVGECMLYAGVDTDIEEVCLLNKITDSRH